jgi:hypothetical protein
LKLTNFFALMKFLAREGVALRWSAGADYPLYDGLIIFPTALLDECRESRPAIDIRSTRQVEVDP